MAEAQAQAQAQAQAVVAYVTPKLLEAQVDRRHRSYQSAVLGERLGHVRARTSRMLMPIHDLWVPKYVN